MPRHAYALPNWHNPRVITTAASRRELWLGTQIFPAYLRRGQLKHLLLRLKTLTLGRARRHVDTFDLLADLRAFAEPHVGRIDNITIMLGPPSPTTTTTIELRRQGTVIGYVRIADRDGAAWRIAHEDRILRALPKGVGPTSLAFGSVADQDALLTSPVTGERPAARRGVSAAQTAVAERLVLPGLGYDIKTHPFIVDLATDTADRRLRIWTDSLRGGLWPVAVLHGDLAAWNIKVHNQTARLIDWEFGRLRGLPHVDILVAIQNMDMNVLNLSENAAFESADSYLRTTTDFDERGRAALVAIAMLHALREAAQDDPPSTDAGQRKRRALMDVAARAHAAAWPAMQTHAMATAS